MTPVARPYRDDVLARACDAEQVQTGTLWLTQTDNLVLVLDEISARTFSIVFWPADEEFGGPGSVTSMMSAELLAFSSLLLASPLPALQAQIADVMAGVHRDAQAIYAARHANTGPGA
jgi:hypothetical protein